MQSDNVRASDGLPVNQAPTGLGHSAGIPDACQYIIDMVEDRPAKGMWHCGPNAAWVTVTHLPTMISARAFDANHWHARKAAQACCEMMVEQSRLLKCQFPDRLAQAIEARRAATTGAVHESAVGNADAPHTTPETPND